jgi:hypothetical protein
MADTLLLDTVAWDLVLDIDNDIAVASDPYSQAQDAASAIRLFAGEAWYDTTQGVPYWTQILGQLPPLSLIKSALTTAALSVLPSGTKVAVFITGLAATTRQLTGQIQITTDDGQTATALF